MAIMTLLLSILFIATIIHYPNLTSSYQHVDGSIPTCGFSPYVWPCCEPTRTGEIVDKKCLDEQNQTNSSISKSNSTQ